MSIPEGVRVVGAIKRWLDRSLTAQAVLVLVVGVGVTALFRRDEHPALWLIQGVLYAAVAVTFLALQRRRLGRAVGAGPGEIARLHRGVRHREVPREPERREAMRRLVDVQLRQMEGARRWMPYWFAAMGFIAVAVIVLGAVGGTLVLPAVTAVGVIALWAWVLWMRRRSLDRLHHMRSALARGGEQAQA
ncbi:hypothetical protein ABZY00_18210 [Streptomyces griseoflavus]|uniref:hypothetical protein n=1 Tax=Streptomyces griseoflavus TaxID=35619 RepID=UPI0033B346CC